MYKNKKDIFKWKKEMISLKFIFVTHENKYAMQLAFNKTKKWLRLFNLCVNWPLWLWLFEKRKQIIFFIEKKGTSIHFSILIMDIPPQELAPLLIWAILKLLQQRLCLPHHLRTFLIQNWGSQLIQERNHLLTVLATKWQGVNF